MFAPFQNVRLNQMMPWLLTALGLLATLAMFLWAHQDAADKERASFEASSARLAWRIERRLRTYEQALQGGAALFNASQTVSQTEWRTFERRIGVERAFPGMVGIGFIEPVPEARILRYVEGARRGGAPDFEVSPPGARKDYFVIRFIEPVERNLQALGFDIGSTASRRIPAEAARDTGQTRITPKIALVQDTDRAASFLMLVPLYTTPETPATLAQRRQMFVGWVYAPLNAETLLRAIVAEGDAPALDVDVFEGKPALSTMLFSTRPDVSPSTFDARNALTASREIALMGRVWTVRTGLAPHAVGGPWATRLNLAIWLSGVSLSLLLGAYTHRLVHGRTRALQLAVDMTREVVETGSVLENALEGIAKLDDQGFLIAPNVALCDLLGCQGSESLVRPWYTFFHPADASRLRDLYLELLHSGDEKRVAEARVLLPDASVLNVEIILVNMPRDMLARNRTMLFVRDITPRMRDLAKRQEQAHLIDQIASLVPCSLYVFDLDANAFVYRNAGLEKILNFETAALDAMGASLFPRLVHPEDFDAVSRRFEHLCSGQEGPVHVSEYRMRHASGGWKWLCDMNRVYSRAADGRVRQIIGVAFDVTERKKIEGAVAQERERLFEIISSSPIAVAMLDADLRILVCSRAWMETDPWRPGTDPRGQAFLDAYPDVPEAVSSGLVRVLKGDPVSLPEQVVRRTDGSQAVFRCEYRPWRRMEGEVGGIILAREDITDLVRAREAAKDASRAALEHARLKSEFLANMSHEIRTPLNGILGMTDLLCETSLDARQQRFVGIILESGKALLNIVNDVLDFSKIESGKMELEALPFDLADLVESQVEVLASRAWEKGISLNSYVCPKLSGLYVGDPGRIGQILLNLISNAIKFTHQGGVLLSAEAKEQESPATASELREKGEREDASVALVFSIADTGIGMSPDAVNRLFQPFTQADGSTARKYGGTGLGLSICKRLAELMQGNLCVESREGVGSTFRFEVTLKVAKIETTAEAAQAAQPFLARSAPGDGARTSEPRARALIIEEDALAARCLRSYLEAWGYAVESASHGREAISLLSELSSRRAARFTHVLCGNVDGIDVVQAQLARICSVAASAPPASSPVGERRPVCVRVLGFNEVPRSGASSMAVRGSLAAIFAGTLHQPFKRAEVGSALSGNREALPGPSRRIAAVAPVPASERTPTIQAPGVSSRPARASAPPSNASLKLRVLVAEDNNVNAMILRLALEDFGAHVVVADDGATALAAWREQPREQPFDLVIMDCQMPHMDGYELARAMRAEERHRQTSAPGRRASAIPIVALTGNARSEDRQRCLDAGMDDVLVKPVSKETLYAVITRTLVQGAARSAGVRGGLHEYAL